MFKFNTALRQQPNIFPVFLWRLKIEKPEIIKIGIDTMVSDNNDVDVRVGANSIIDAITLAAHTAAMERGGAPPPKDRPGLGGWKLAAGLVALWTVRRVLARTMTLSNRR